MKRLTFSKNGFAFTVELNDYTTPSSGIDTSCYSVRSFIKKDVAVQYSIAPFFACCGIMTIGKIHVASELYKNKEFNEALTESFDFFVGKFGYSAAICSKIGATAFPEEEMIANGWVASKPFKNRRTGNLVTVFQKNYA